MKNKKNILKEQIDAKQWLTVEEAIEAINKAFQSLEEKQI